MLMLHAVKEWKSICFAYRGSQAQSLGRAQKGFLSETLVILLVSVNRTESDSSMTQYMTVT